MVSKITLRETMARDDPAGITVNEYADCNLETRILRSDHVWAIFWDGVLIEHIPDALDLCRYLMKNKLP